MVVLKHTSSGDFSTHRYNKAVAFCFTGEFGSERLVQKVVDTILRNTAAKDLGESSKGAEGGSTQAEWKDDTASKIILTGFKVIRFRKKLKKMKIKINVYVEWVALIMSSISTSSRL